MRPRQHQTAETIGATQSSRRFGSLCFGPLASGTVAVRSSRRIPKTSEHSSDASMLVEVRSSLRVMVLLRSFGSGQCSSDAPKRFPQRSEHFLVSSMFFAVRSSARTLDSTWVAQGRVGAPGSA